MNALPLEELLAPLGDAAPCGSDLEYDAAFLALGEAARGKAEQQFGDTVIPAEEPDWRIVHQQALDLARRTRDLRIAVWLARAGARLGGVAGYADGLALIAGLLERHWAQVHPQLDASDNNDPTMRVNALAALAEPPAGLNDLRKAVIGNGRSATTVRQVELASGKVQPRADETVLAAEGLQQALTEAEAQSPGLYAAMQRPHADLLRIEAVLGRELGAQGPDLRPLQGLTGQLAQTAAQLLAQSQPAEAADSAAADGNAPAAAKAGANNSNPRSREDVVRLLERACHWIEQNEPSSPAPLLIRRAQRLMTMSFMDIMRDLAPDGVGQVEKIAGRAE